VYDVTLLNLKSVGDVIFATFGKISLPHNLSSNAGGKYFLTKMQILMLLAFLGIGIVMLFYESYQWQIL
jgi:preprotein translocase subunit SecG